MQKISLLTAIFTGINAMIGAGILAVPAQLAESSQGNSGIYILILGSLLVLCLGLSMAKMSILYPSHVWNYDFPKKFGGHFFGSVVSKMYTLGVLVAMGFLVQQSGVWLHDFITYAPPALLGQASLWVLAAFVLGGVEIASWFQTLVGVLVVLSLFSASIIGWHHVKWSDFNLCFPNAQETYFLLPIGLFGLIGFESLLSMVSIIKNPEKKLFYAMGGSIFFVAALNLFFVGGLLFSIPKSLLIQSQTLGTLVREVFSDYKFLPFLLYLASFLAIWGTLMSMLWSLSTVLHKQTQYGTQKITIILTIIIGLFAYFLKSNHIIAGAMWLIVACYVSSIVHLLTLKSQWISGFNVITLLGFLAGCTMMYTTGLNLVSLFL